MVSEGDSAMHEEQHTAPSLTNPGERLMTDNQTHTALEHLHRYALAHEIAAGLDVLDVACGEGYGSNLLAGCARSVVGVDVAADVVAHAAAKYRRKNLRYLHGSATAVPLPAAAVDLVVSFETIEHLREHDEMLAELRRVLRPGGRMIISSPDRRFYSEATGHANPYHLKELSCEEFRELVARFFPYVRLLRQRVVYGSLIVPEGQAAGFREYRGDFTGYARDAQLQDAMYDVIVASDAALPDWPLSLWDGTPFRGERSTAAGRHADLPPGQPAGVSNPQANARPGLLGRVRREVRRICRQLAGIGNVSSRQAATRRAGGLGLMSRTAASGNEIVDG
jgi:O-antigen biosynthesis protein